MKIFPRSSAVFACGSMVWLVAACSVTVNGTTSDSGLPTNGTTALGFHASNLGSVLETVDLTKLIDIDVTTTDATPSSSCNSQANNGCFAATVSQADGSTLQVYFAKSWKIEPTTNFRVTDKTPIALVALTTIQVLGTITADADGFSAVAGGFGGAGNPPKGNGPGGGGWTGSAPSIGAGGGGHCGAGGTGGAASGTMGAAGIANGNATLVPLSGGSAGGGNGGGGGGAIEFAAGTSIEIGANAHISAGGGGGGGPSGSSQNASGANGGGAGGALLFEAPTVTVTGTLAANGGGGGGSGDTSPNGKNANPNATPASGGSAGDAHAGGDGAAAATAAGGDGEIGDDSHAGSAGGGGAGFIRFNTKTALVTYASGYSLSPSEGGPCVSLGTLAL